MSETSQNKTAPDKTKDKSKKRDRLASEERLLKAAEEVFSKHGFKGATTRLIAKKAQVNESLIGRYFDGKMGLLLSIIEKHVSNFRTQGLTYPPQENLRDEIKCFINERFDRNCRKNFDFFKIVISQALVDAKFTKKILEKAPPADEPFLCDRLQALMDQNKMKKCDPKTVAQDLDVQMFGIMLNLIVLRGVPREAAFEVLNRFIDRYASALEI